MRVGSARAAFSLLVGWVWVADNTNCTVAITNWLRQVQRSHVNTQVDPRPAGGLQIKASKAFNSRISRTVTVGGHFLTEQAALKCVYLAVMSLDPTGKGRKHRISR